MLSGMRSNKIKTTSNEGIYVRVYLDFMEILKVNHFFRKW